MLFGDARVAATQLAARCAGRGATAPGARGV